MGASILRAGTSFEPSQLNMTETREIRRNHWIQHDSIIFIPLWFKYGILWIYDTIIHGRPLDNLTVARISTLPMVRPPQQMVPEDINLPKICHRTYTHSIPCIPATSYVYIYLHRASMWDIYIYNSIDVASVYIYMYSMWIYKSCEYVYIYIAHVYIYI